ncbi:MAG TPA: APC family permease [Vicinamibacterales bacterium]|nr:APC family permease [Vicinamibacterales bacterium]
MPTIDFDDADAPTSREPAAQAAVEAHSAGLRKDLGLADVTLTQILFIVGLPWVGVAAEQGRAHIVYWLIALSLFYLPSAAVVTHLNRAMPLEGGLYQWAKLGFNDLTGFMVAWNLWLFAILSTSETGLQVTQYLAYVVGPRGQWVTQSPWFVSAANVAILSGLVAITVRGLSVGKWVHKAGGILMLTTFGMLLALPVLNVMHGTLHAYHPLAAAVPVVSLFSLNIAAKMGFGAFGGFEYVAIHAGECRNPARTIARSVAIAAPVIAVMFILGTSSVLALVPIDRIDLIAPIPQVLSIGFSALGPASAVAPITIVVLLGIRLAQASVSFAGNTRLPMVAGWDGLLPAWFTRLHGTYRTPANSIVFVGAVTLAFSIAGLIGVGKQEAFQLLWNASGIFYALTYLVMFAIPIAAIPSPLWLKAAAASGFLMTLLYIVLSILPIVQVASWLSFALKISLVIVLANAVGFMIFASKRSAPVRP